MNIVHIVYSMEVGGAETIIAQLCRLQRMQGHSPSVHCLYEIGPIGKLLQADGFEVVLHRPPTFIGLMRSLYRALRRNQPDVVHCHNAKAAIVGAIPARIAGVNSVIVTRHSPFGHRDLPRDLKFAVASRFCDLVIAVCEDTRRNILAAPLSARNKVVRVYNGASAVITNNEAIVPKVGFTLLNVGRLSPVKDQESLLRAFALAKCHVPDLQLWIVGDGPLRRRLQQLTHELGIDAATQFFGEQRDVAPFYCAADLFVLSSVSEGLPMSLLEAMSAGLHSIVTDVGGMREVSCLSRSIVTVPPSNSMALADAIREAARCRDGLAQLGDAARRCYLQNFTLERMAHEYIRLYKYSSTMSLTEIQDPSLLH
jgi:glycosyltransferase involved in cell wall biosynthesis